MSTRQSDWTIPLELIQQAVNLSAYVLGDENAPGELRLEAAGIILDAAAAVKRQELIGRLEKLEQRINVT